MNAIWYLVWTALIGVFILAAKALGLGILSGLPWWIVALPVAVPVVVFAGMLLVFALAGNVQ